MARPSRRDEILDAAVACFAENGSSGTSLSEIAERAGVTHTAVRYHFDSRTALVLAVLAERDRRMRQENVELLRGDAVALLSRLPEIARLNLAQLELARLYLVLEAESLKGDDTIREWFVQRRRVLRGQIASIVRSGIRSGDFRADVDPDLKADEILAVLEGAHLQHLVDPEDVDLVAVMGSYRDALLRDLRASG